MRAKCLIANADNPFDMGFEMLALRIVDGPGPRQPEVFVFKLSSMRRQGDDMNAPRRLAPYAPSTAQ